MTWFKIRSWHALTITSRGGMLKSRCGKWAPAGSPESPTLPLDERSCENCLRYTLHDQGLPPPDDDVVPG